MPCLCCDMTTRICMLCVSAGIMQAPLVVGSDLRKITGTSLATLSNKQAIDINQDPAAFSPKVVAKSSHHQVWVRPLHGGDIAVALFNSGADKIDITVELSDVVCATCARKATVVDVWGGDELGSWGPAEAVQAVGSYTAKAVYPHETILLRMTPENDCIDVESPLPARILMKSDDTSSSWYFRSASSSSPSPPDGSSYATAWTSVAAIEWARISPGDTLFVCGLHDGGSADGALNITKAQGSGVAGAPVTIDGRCVDDAGRADPGTLMAGKLVTQRELGSADAHGIYTYSYDSLPPLPLASVSRRLGQHPLGVQAGLGTSMPNMPGLRRRRGAAEAWRLRRDRALLVAPSIPGSGMPARLATPAYGRTELPYTTSRRPVSPRLHSSSTSKGRKRR